ncbi:unnamed protein product, partial [Amoebophrya sp. A25]|eukprot:GSA25T00012819001.1
MLSYRVRHEELCGLFGVQLNGSNPTANSIVRWLRWLAASSHLHDSFVSSTSGALRTSSRTSSFLQTWESPKAICEVLLRQLHAA